MIHAQSWPEKPVRMVVPFPPGGPLDVVARILAVPLQETFKQPFIVDNRPGATGNIGMEAVAKAPPDGHTLLWVLDSMLTVNPILFKVEPLERLKPVALITEGTGVLAVNPNVKARTAAEFAKLSHSSDMSYGSAGLGSPGHRQMELYGMLSGAKLTHVPYKGNALAVQALLAGDIHAFITPVAGVLQQVKAGKLRAVAVTSGKRSPALPDVPTMVESGYPRYVSVAWFSVFVPIKTPQAIADTLERELIRLMQMPAVREAITRLGTEPSYDTARSIPPRAAEERKLWAEVIEKTGMKIE
jgi:tripartite-type tricarboxylate transporter receptor subunit TctC